MRLCISIAAFLVLSISGSAQTVFFEPFDESDNATSGTENSGGGVTWSSTCATCVPSNDWYNVESGQFENQDSNGPAIWTTGSIDITACTGLEISMDLEEDGTMEDCSECSGTGSNCVDYIKLEYNLDGSGWTEVVGTTCAGSMTWAPGELINQGDLTPDGGPVAYTSPCIDFGSTLQLRITTQTWAAAERYRFDNVSVDCNDCVLPVVISNFDVSNEGNHVLLNWTTSSESYSDYFLVERSFDGSHFVGIGKVDAQGNSSVEMDYRFMDNELPRKGIVYYRLRQMDLDGKARFSKTRSLRIYQNEVRYVDGNIQLMLYDDVETNFTLNVYDLGGKLVHSEIVGNSTIIPWMRSGFYLIDIPELNIRQKIAVP